MQNGEQARNAFLQPCDRFPNKQFHLNRIIKRTGFRCICYESEYIYIHISERVGETLPKFEFVYALCVHGVRKQSYQHFRCVTAALPISVVRVAAVYRGCVCCCAKEKIIWKSFPNAIYQRCLTTTMCVAIIVITACMRTGWSENASLLCMSAWMILTCGKWISNLNFSIMYILHI